MKNINLLRIIYIKIARQWKFQCLAIFIVYLSHNCLTEPKNKFPRLSCNKTVDKRIYVLYT